MFARAFGLIGATCFLLLPAPGRADIFTVTNTTDGGPGSLRQAILDANAHPNASAIDRDQIHFAIPGSDVQTIFPRPPLPDITDPVVVDGFTQPGSLPNTNPVGQGLNTVLKIELDGWDLLWYGNGLTITCGNTTVRGLIISRFLDGIVCRRDGGNLIAGNFLGTDRTGTFAPVTQIIGREPRQLNGVTLDNSEANRIGGRDAASRNLISGASFADVYIKGPNSRANVVEGNLMGTNASGMASVVNGSAYSVWLEDGASENLIGGTVIEARNVMGSSEMSGGYYVGVAFAPTVNGLAPPFANLVKGNFMGLNVTGKGAIDADSYGVAVGGHHNVIGGTEPGAGNIISGNRGGGMLIGLDSEEWAATENVIQGNFIGTDDSGTLPLGNGRWGIRVGDRANNNTIGGTEPGAGNRIAYTYTGLFADPPVGMGIGFYSDFQGGSVGNAILGNLIYGNEKLGIDHNMDLVSANDPGDADIGPNDLQNYPVLTSADFASGAVIIRGTLESQANQSYRLEFFGDTAADALEFGEGRAFLGGANLITGADGTAAFEWAWPCPAGVRSVSATATDSNGSTSEFSRSMPIAGTPAAQLLNISTRLGVQTGESVLIGGFIITGVDPKKVIIRGIGPSLPQGFGGSLADPALQLFSGTAFLASNDNWQDYQQSEIEATGIPPNHHLESAIVQTLAPGAYTAVLSGRNNTTGLGLVEVYDLDQTVISQLANISTRGLVGTDDNVMIGGLIVGPAGGGKPTVVRAIGPSLGGFGIDGALQDPTLDLVNSDGAIIRSNNNWREMQQAEIEAVGLQPGDDRESALLETIPPGNYTAIVRGAGNTTGVALVEVYHLP